VNPDEIKQAREAAGLSLRELADKANVSASTISRIERGKGNPSFENLLSIYRALGLGEPASEIYAETTEERRLISAWRDKNYSTILELLAEKLKED
jgi:transcriptional regulator with XRE-family HTH domain